MRNKINKKIFVVIIFVLFFYKILITEAYTTTIVPASTGEGDIYVVKSYEAPKNNEIRVGDSAMFTFHIYLKELDAYEKRDKIYLPMYLYFVGNADNETLSGDKDKENVAVKEPSDRVANAGKDETFKADVTSLGKPGSKSYTWFLLDNNIIDSNNKRKVVASGSFTFKKDLQWYNQVQIKEPTQTSFDTNGPFSTEPECKTNLALQLKQKNYDWQYSTYQVCKQSLDMPIESTVQNIKPVAGSAVSSVYTFLAPIGTMTEINTTDIGVYFNWIFKLAIGLCAALAVVMIIVGGVQYMGDESVFGKTDAKDRITKAILGLLIAIGSWVLLNTINPALTGVNGVSVAGVTIEVEDGEETTGIPEKTISINYKNINACDESVLRSASLFGSTIKNKGVNKEILADINAMNAEYAKLPESSPIKKYVQKGFSISRGFGSACTKTRSGKWSAHSFGLALDINGANNPYPVNKNTSCVTDMPKEFVAFMRKHGWGWGAAFNDPMHFSKLSSEVSQTSNGSCKPK